MSSQLEDAHPDPPCDHGLTGGRGADERCFECGCSVTEKPGEERTEYRVVGPRWRGTTYQHRDYAEDERRCMIDPARYRIEQRTVTMSDWVTVSDE